MKLIKLPSGDWIRPDLIGAILISKDGPLTVELVLVSSDVRDRVVIPCLSGAERNKLAFQIAEACST